MPKSNRRVIRAKKNNEKKSKSLSGIIFFVILLLVLMFLIKFTTKYWNGTDKVAFAFKGKDGEVGVSILDPKLKDFTTLVIPADTQVDVAENYGTLRIKNVWQLGINEKKKGRLLSETVSRNFRFPLNLWSDNDATSLKDGKFFSVLKFIIVPKATNIPFGDRLSMGFFALRTGSSNKSEIDLGKSQYLHSEKLSDGQPGFIQVGTISEHLQVYFVDNAIAESSARVSILDGTGRYVIAQAIGEILEVMGGKVVSIDKNADLPDTDCIVSGKDKKIVNKISALFSCSTKNLTSDIDLQITLGAKFAKRF